MFFAPIFNRMVERKIDNVMAKRFKALGDPTRMQLFTLLAQQGPTRVTDLAPGFEMSLNAVSKHLKYLENAGLLVRLVKGREHLMAVNPSAFAAISDWFASAQNLWQQRLDRLAELIESPSTEHIPNRREDSND